MRRYHVVDEINDFNLKKLMKGNVSVQKENINNL